MIVEEVVRVGSEHGEQRAPIRALGCLDEPVANRADGRRVSGLRAIAERRRRRHVEREGMLDRPRTAANRGGIGVNVGQGDEAAGKAAGGRDCPSDLRHRQNLRIGDVENALPGAARRNAHESRDVGGRRGMEAAPPAIGERYRGTAIAHAFDEPPFSRMRGADAADRRRPQDCQRRDGFIEQRALQRRLARRVGRRPGLDRRLSLADRIGELRKARFLSLVERPAAAVAIDAR